MRSYLLCCLLLLLGLGVAHGQVADAPITGNGSMPQVDIGRFPTYANLGNTIVPQANRLDIAKRLLGYDLLTYRNNAGVPAVGEFSQFYVIDTSQSVVALVNAELWGVGQHAYLWIEDGGKIDKTAIDGLLSAFDVLVYNRVRELWGEEPNPGIDNDSRVHLLFSRKINPAVSAYFTSQHTYPAQIVRNSNEREMLIFNLNEFENILMSSRTVSVMAHEFQHMIRHNVDGNETAWIDEGFSTFTEKYLGLDDNNVMVNAFMNSPNTQINNWGNTFASYGASLMFMQYFYDRFGLQGMQRLSTEPADGLLGVDKTLESLTGGNVDEFFADWVLANLIQNVAQGYGYQNGWQALPTPSMTDVVSAYPYTRQESANQYATHYYTFYPTPNATQMTFSLEKPSESSLLSEGASSGVRYWYSNIGDESNTTLTRAFDLRSVTQATLIYRMWYELETYWDYMYVTISVDGGNRWQLLEGRRTTADNPNDRSYGVGYTGYSLKWVTDGVDLTPFVGQEVLVRFEMITDDAKTLPGVALDDITIPEINYLADFEADDGGWVSEGWVLSDNRLPQRTWIQAVQYVGEQVNVTRWLVDESSVLNLPLLPNVSRVTLAVSPFAPVTSVPMAYTLNVSVP